MLHAPLAMGGPWTNATVLYQTLLGPVWITKELKEILNKKKRIFFTGSESEKKEVNREVKRAINTAKLKYKNKVEEKFTQGNLCLAWQGLKTMAAVNIATTNHKPIQVAGSSSTSLPDDLNAFYTRFETDNSTQIAETLSSLEHGGTTLTFKTDEVVRALRRIRENSSPGPDNISGRVLRLCAEQLGGVFQTLFQRQRELAAASTTSIHGEPVERVEYKYLGLPSSTTSLSSPRTQRRFLRKCHQRQYLLRKLNNFEVSKNILLTFYYSFIESIATFSIPCWFHSISLQNRNRLESIAKVCSKIIGLPTRSLSSIHK
ncbi:hypothetical protein GBF38_012653, partial [Nibea albiflora]